MSNPKCKGCNSGDCVICGVDKELQCDDCQKYGEGVKQRPCGSFLCPTCHVNCTKENSCVECVVEEYV